VLGDYVELTKPKVQSLLLLTTIATMYVAGDPSLLLVALTCLGGYLSAGGAGAVNHWYDRDIDARMARTADAIAQGSLAERLPTRRGGSETDQLAEAVNRAFDAQARADEVARARAKALVLARTAPEAIADLSAHSSGVWLIPFRHGTKIMAAGQTRARKAASWPAPLAISTRLNPSRSAARANAL